MRRDLVALALVMAAACAIRIVPAWSAVFGGPGVGFLETDAWYHLRLVENQVRNFPWRVTLDPYAASGGQFVPIAPLYDTLTSAAVVLLHGRDADSAAIARIAAFGPPVLGMLAIVMAWAIARRMFSPRAGLLAAALLAILPGHFLDRTTLGFVDHHAIEACLALATVLAVVRAVQVDRTSGAGSANVSASATAGGVLGLYLLSWGSGAFLVAILGLWLLLLVPLSTPADIIRLVARAVAVAATVALGTVIGFQDPRMHRFGTQVLSLVGLLATALLLMAVSREGGAPASTRHRKAAALAAVLGSVLIASMLAWIFDVTAFRQLMTDVERLAPDPSRMGVLEARPLFLYPGEWTWMQPWRFFKTGFYIGLIALVAFASRVWRDRRPPDLLLWTFGVVTFAATAGQNRFGYYLVPACALLGAWLADRLLAWRDLTSAEVVGPEARWRLAIQRNAGLVAIVATFAPNLVPGVLLQSRTGVSTPYWHDTMQWLQQHTPPPFAGSASAGDEYYLARYPTTGVPVADYVVMNWWDQGYYVIQRARRVPVANPTQERAPNAARFYTETDEVRATELLRREGVRYVLADWELPFRLTREGTISGRFQTLVDWAGTTHADYYQVCYRRTGATWTPVWLFFEPYYRSMAFRLAVLGGRLAIPANSTTVVTRAERTDTRGMRFCELVTERSVPTYQAAVEHAAALSALQPVVAGLDPWRAAFPIAPVDSLIEVHATRTPEQRPTETPWVRVFEVR